MRCPRRKCAKRIADLQIDDGGELVVVDLGLDARKLDPKAPLTWSSEDWERHLEARRLANELLNEDAAMRWPDVDRATSPSGKSDRLRIPGPLSQFQAVRQVGRPPRVTFVLAQEEDEPEDWDVGDIDEGDDDAITETDDEWRAPLSTPWIFECSCGVQRIVRYEKLLEYARAALRMGEHNVFLP